MFERFTDRARRVVVLAQEEARLLNHNYIGTEHILLGLIHEGEGVAAKALESLGISLEAVRTQVEEIIGQGHQSPSGHIPFTPRAKKVLELSLREAASVMRDVNETSKDMSRPSMLMLKGTTETLPNGRTVDLRHFVMSEDTAKHIRAVERAQFEQDPHPLMDDER